MEVHIVTTIRRIIAIGIERAVFERLAPVLRRDQFDVDWIPTLEAALILVTEQPFDILILNAAPFGEPLENVLGKIRSHESASSGAVVMVLGKPDGLDRARALKGRGVNQVMLASDPPEMIRERIANLLEVAPRAKLHLPIKLEATVGKKDKKLFCQTENLSSSGMLVRTRHQPELGSTVAFSIQLSENAGTIFGHGEMVRHSAPEVGGIDGVGIRFLSISGNGAQRLENHLAGHVS